MDNKKNSSLKAYFASMLSGKMSEGEIKNFKEEMQNHKDEEVLIDLEKLWEETAFSDFGNKEEKEKIKTLIDNNCIETSALNKKTIRLNWLKYAAVAAILFAVGLGGIQLYEGLNGIDKVEKIIAVKTRAGEKATVTLPDGSIVKLNAASTLTYPENFAAACRHVSLEGEAYFDVQKMNGKKFIVNTKTHAIEVLGTSFNVMSYTQDQLVEIVLLQGKVKVSKTYGNTGEVMLEPNEKYAFNVKLNEITVTQTNADFETAWMRNELVFRNEAFKNVLNKLERFYGVNISSSRIESIENETFNGRFENNDIQKVLEILAVHYPIKYTIEKNNIAISVKK